MLLCLCAAELTGGGARCTREHWAQPLFKQGTMEYDRDSTRLPYRGWEIRSHLTHVSIEGTVAAGAALFFEQACQCHIISCRQFANGGDAIHAIETKASIWIDDRQSHPRTSYVEHSLLS